MHQITLTGRNLVLTDAIKKLTSEKFEKLFHHASEILSVRVELGFETNRLDKNCFTVKGHIALAGKAAEAVATSDDLYKSIDMAVRKLDEQLRRRHTRAAKPNRSRLAA